MPAKRLSRTVEFKGVDESDVPRDVVKLAEKAWRRVLVRWADPEGYFCPGMAVSSPLSLGEKYQLQVCGGRHPSVYVMPLAVNGYATPVNIWLKYKRQKDTKPLD